MAAHGRTRLALADGCLLFCEGLRSIFEKHLGFTVEAIAVDGLVALSLAKKVRPDILVSDVLLPGMSGFEVARILACEAAAVKVVFLTGCAGDAFIYEAFKVGAWAYFLKTISPEELVRGVSRVAEGHLVVDQSVETKLIRCFRGPDGRGGEPKDSGFAGLSWRELMVLELIGRGCTNREIAEKMYISEKTVRSHCVSIYRKLNVKHRTQAAILAATWGLTKAAGGPRDPG